MKLEEAGQVRVSNGSARRMAAVLRGEGLDLDAALAVAEIPAAAIDRAAMISGTQEVAFQRAFARLTADRPALWVESGLGYRSLGDGDYGMAVMTAPSLTAVAALCDWGLDLIHSCARWSGIYESHRLVGMRQTLDSVPSGLRKFTLYRDIGTSLASLREIAPDIFPHMTLHLPLPTADLASIRTLCGDAVIEPGRRVEWRWAAEHSDWPLAHSDEVLHRHYVDCCRATLTAIRSRGFADLLAATVRAQIEQPTLARVAGAMNLSVRTLQRRLDEAGTNFRAAVDQIRELVAKQRLARGEATIADIAFGLGYRSQSSFNHAFRRWTGTYPTAFRRMATPDLRAGLPRG